jgi:carbonic anhydrase
VLRVPAIIICGHTDCGVIKGAINPAALTDFPDVTYWLRHTKIGRRKYRSDPKTILALTERNVVTQLKNLRTHPAVAARLKKRDLALHGWVYHIATGDVTAYDAQRRKFRPL